MKKPRKPRPTKPADGTFMELWWDDRPDWHLVYGHVTPLAARATMEHPDYHIDLKDMVPAHLWAANLQTWESRRNELGYSVHLYDSPGRGRYAVTAFLLPSHPLALKGLMPCLPATN